MGIMAKKGSDTVPISEGVHIAVCNGIYDIGTQFSEKFGKSAHQAIIIWELPEERIDIQKEDKTINLPRAISKKYTLSLHEKSNLRKDLESWRGRAFTDEELNGFDLTKLLGANCMIQVIHKKGENKVYANIASITPLYKGCAKREPENPIRFFSMSDNIEIPEGTPDWIKDLINESAEFQGARENEASCSDSSGDDVPF